MTRRPYSGLSRRDREADAADMIVAADLIGPLLDAAEDSTSSPGVPVASADSGEATPREAADTVFAATDSPGGEVDSPYAVTECTPLTEHVQQVETEGLEPRETIVAALEQARVVGVLDAWATKENYVRMGTNYDGQALCVLVRGLKGDKMFYAATPDAARAAAAKAITEGAV